MKTEEYPYYRIMRGLTGAGTLVTVHKSNLPYMFKITNCTSNVRLNFPTVSVGNFHLTA